jgi:hypothetical protein
MPYEALLEQYLAGAGLVREAVSGMSTEELQAKPISGRWSTLEVVCHLADAEALYAERLKRVLAEHEPSLPRANPDSWVPRLAYQHRDVEEELRLIELIRSQMVRILRTLGASDYQRQGIHSTDGPLTLATLLQRVTEHIPHHVRFIHEKRMAQRDNQQGG